MRGFIIDNVRLVLFEARHHKNATVVVEWVHDTKSASQVLKMCGGPDLNDAAMLGDDNEFKGMKTVRTFRFESCEDAIATYDEFVEKLRDQPRVDVREFNGPQS